jgi:hypothetical protein
MRASVSRLEGLGARTQGRPWWLAGVMAACLLLAAQAAAPANGQAAAAPRAGQALPVRISLTHTSQSIPRSFLGLSVEVNELLSYVQEGAVFDRAISLLRTARGDPMMLRVGGKSADDAYWDTQPLNAPRWVFEIGDDWLGQLATLARRDRLRVTLDLNLAVHSPSMAASLAAAAFAALAPGGRLAGLAVGNEPDLFPIQPGLDNERISTTAPSTPPDWTRTYSPSTYRNDYLMYAGALDRAAPDVPLAGPETTTADPRWLQALVGLGRLGPRSLTVHRYASSTCWSKSSPRYPRISSLLAEHSSAGIARRLRGAVKLAHDAGMSLDVSELNSISCGGNPGVADSFATALWAPDMLFELIRSGVDGVSWHIRPALPNAPFELLPGAIEPLPELYGLTVFAEMIGPDARRLGVRVAAGSDTHLKVWAVSSRVGTSVLLINKGPSEASVSLSSMAGGRPARVARLSAPSVGSRTGVTLAGRSIGSDARWHGNELTTAIRPERGAYHLAVPGYSAALVQVARLGASG